MRMLQLQERPEDVPTGELPRNILMTVDRAMVGTIAPGTRVTAVAIYSTVQVRLCSLRLCSLHCFAQPLSAAL